MKRFFAGLLIGIGLLIMTTSGLCSLWVVVMTLPDFEAVMLPWIFGIGGIPFIVGYGVFALGRLMLREVRRDEAEE